jgi:hypothetical protein
MSIGPVQYIVVAFPGNEFKGEIVPALADLVDGGLIRVLDLAFVVKDAEGNVAAMELSDLGDAAAAFAPLGAEPAGLFSDEDLEAAGEELELNSSAALLVWEDLWATQLRDAIADAGGILLDHDRIPAEVVQAAVEWASAQA